MVRIIRASGKVEEKGESVGEFQARQQRRRISKRGKTSAELQRERLAMERLKAEAERIKALKPTKVVTKSGETVFRVFDPRSGTRVDSTSSDVRLNVQFIRNRPKIQAVTSGEFKAFTVQKGGVRRDVLTQKAIQTQKSILKKEKGREPTALVTGVPSGTILGGIFGKKQAIPKRQDVTVLPVSKIIDVPVVRSLTEKFSRNGDVKTAKQIIKLQKEGKFTVGVKKEFEKKLREQEKAIKKAKAINAKLDEFNQNYNRAIEPVLNVLLPESEKKGIKLTFAGRVAKRVLREGSKIANPIIVGTEIGGNLEAFRVLKNAGVTNIPKATKQIINVLSNPDFYKQNFNPKTVNGLSNLIIGLTIIGVPQKIIKGVARGGGRVLKTTGGQVSAGGKLFVSEVQNTVKKLLVDKSGALRGRRAIKGKVSKVELRKRNIARQFNTITRQQRKALKAPIGKDVPKTKAIRKAEAVQRSKAVAKQKLEQRTIFIQTPSGFSIKRGDVQVFVRKDFGKLKSFQARKVSNEVSKSVKSSHSGFGNSVSVTVQKQSKGARRRAKAKLKQDKKELSRREKRRVVRLEQQVTKKERTRKQIDNAVQSKLDDVLKGKKKPDALVVYEGAITTAPKGWRSSALKSKVLTNLKKVTSNIERQSVLEAKKAVSKIKRSKVAKQVWESERRVSKESSRIFNLLKNPKLDMNNAIKALTDVRIARLIDDSLIILSLFRFSFANAQALKRSVRALPVIKEVSDPVAKEIFKFAKKPKKVRKPVVKKPVRKKSVTKPVVKKPVKRVVRKPRKIVKSKAVKPRRKRIIRRPKLRKRANKRREVSRVVGGVKREFRPSLEAVLRGLKAEKVPRFITGVEIRPIVVKVVKRLVRKKKKELEADLKAKKKKKGKGKGKSKKVRGRRVKKRSKRKG